MGLNCKVSTKKKLPVQVCINILALAYSTLSKNSIMLLFKNETISIVKCRPKKIASTSMYQHTCTDIFNIEAKNGIILLLKNETISIVKIRPKKKSPVQVCINILALAYSTLRQKI